MACIKIDKKLQKSEEMANFFLFLLNEDRVNLPRLSLIQLLLGKFRPGLDSDIITSSILSRFNEFGLPSGPLEGGQPNVMELFTRGLVEEIVDSVHTDARVDVAV